MYKRLLYSIIGVFCLGQILVAKELSSCVTTLDISKNMEISKNKNPLPVKRRGTSGPKKIIITSKNGTGIIVKKNSTWDLAQSIGKGGTIEFTGTARLVCEPGSTIIAHDNVLIFSDQARWLII